MGTLVVEYDDRAVDVRFAADSVCFVLADQRSISAPLAWFPRLLKASEEQRDNWRWLRRALARCG